jgi:hypothetical protein
MKEGALSPLIVYFEEGVRSFTGAFIPVKHILQNK